ncbi:hypothetical protein VDGL01_01587 [Verticillium dahliae]
MYSGALDGRSLGTLATLGKANSYAPPTPAIASHITIVAKGVSQSLDVKTCGLSCRVTCTTTVAIPAAGDMSISLSETSLGALALASDEIALLAPKTSDISRD